MIRVFYQFEPDGDGIAGGDAEPIPTARVTDIARRLHAHGDGFIGFVDERDRCLQIAVGDTIIVDVPDPERAGSSTCEITFDRYMDVVRRANRSLDPVIRSLPLTFEPWERWSLIGSLRSIFGGRR